jgi:bacillithiol biosynthesis deacetylase BshB1
MLDVLAIGAHPDDCEIFMGGALAVFKKSGLKIGILNLTKGEMGTYGNAETRAAESKHAGKVLHLDFQRTLDVPDSRVEMLYEYKKKIIDVIRETRPEILFSFLHDTRHPDHGNCGKLVKEAAYLSGLEKIKSKFDKFRPSALIMFPELRFYQKPDFVVDITDTWDKKVSAIKAFSTQVAVNHEDSVEVNPKKTLIHSAEFWDLLEARAKMAGALIGCAYGEPFFTNTPPKINNPVENFTRKLS